MATAQVNESLATPSKWQNVAVSTPLVADHTLVSGTLDLAYRYTADLTSQPFYGRIRP